MPIDAATGEPTGMTLADLIGLVLGFGAAFYLRLIPRGWPSLNASPSPARFAEGVVIWIIESDSMIVVALIPVILTRRWMHRGIISASEWTLLAMAAEAFGTALWASNHSVVLWNVLASLMGITTVVFGLCLALIITSGRAIRGAWLAGLALLLNLSWFLGPASLIEKIAIRVWSGPDRGLLIDSLGSLGFYLLLLAPFLATIGLPLAAGLANLHRPGGPPWTWLQWAGLFAAVTSLVASSVHIPLNRLASGGSSFDFASAFICVPGYAMILATCWWFNRGFGATWARWLGLSDHPFRALITPPET